MKEYRGLTQFKGEKSQLAKPYMVGVRFRRTKAGKLTLTTALVYALEAVKTNNYETTGYICQTQLGNGRWTLKKKFYPLHSLEGEFRYPPSYGVYLAQRRLLLCRAELAQSYARQIEAVMDSCKRSLNKTTGLELSYAT
jgi:hypothetical protein